jgi:hypothetical protein
MRLVRLAYGDKNCEHVKYCNNMDEALDFHNNFPHFKIEGYEEFEAEYSIDLHNMDDMLYAITFNKMTDEIAWVLLNPSLENAKGAWLVSAGSYYEAIEKARALYLANKERISRIVLSEVASNQMQLV